MKWSSRTGVDCSGPRWRPRRTTCRPVWFLAPRGLRASPTRSFFVTLTGRVLTPMISTRGVRVQAARRGVVEGRRSGDGWAHSRRPVPPSGVRAFGTQ
ncbi:hypothetical protein DKG71_24910 [Streptomyces sp. NEAU-S7GS2]|nr:hypothetical protein DKG71_24910 [Streptomyces sp. NEAU-S7GS2]